MAKSRSKSRSSRRTKSKRSHSRKTKRSGSRRSGSRRSKSGSKRTKRSKKTKRTKRSKSGSKKTKRTKRSGSKKGRRGGKRVKLSRADRGHPKVRANHGFKYTVGSPAEVWHGTAHHTPGGNTKSKLKMNKRGHIVSIKKSKHGKKMYQKNKSMLAEPYN